MWASGYLFIYFVWGEEIAYEHNFKIIALLDYVAPSAYLSYTCTFRFIYHLSILEFLVMLPRFCCKLLKKL